MRRPSSRSSNSTIVRACRPTSAHPAHDELGAHFGQLLSAAIVYDFEMLVENGAELSRALEPFIEGIVRLRFRRFFQTEQPQHAGHHAGRLLGVLDLR